MKKTLRLVYGGLLLLCGSAFGQTYQTLDVSSGFTNDVIANGTGSASTTTDEDVDGAGYAFICTDFLATSSSTPITYGLPTSGTISSLATSGLSFQLQSYSSSNSLRIETAATSGTLSLATASQISASSIYLLTTSGSGAGVVDVTVNFSDGTSQTVTGTTIPNWYDSTTIPVAAWGFGRVVLSTDVLQNPTNNPRLYQLEIPITLTNQSKTITGVTVSKTSGGVINVLALSAKTVGSCPSLSSVSASPTAGTAATLNWVLGSYGTGSSSATYTVELYTDSAYTLPVAGTPITGITATSQAVTGLTAETTYYYRVKANNGSCDSEYLTGSFYTGYCTPTGFTTSSTYYLNNVVTTGGSANINNATTSVTGGYANYSATQAVSQIPGGSFNIALSVSSGTNYFYVWVDWNNDMDFSDTGEAVVATTSYTSSYSGTINIPATQAPGNYRMRLSSSYIGAITSACGPAAYGEFEDYTITVLPAPTCYFPTGLAAAYTFTNSTFSWSAPTLGTTPAGYEYVLTTTQGTPTGSGTATTGTSFTADTTIGTTYYLYVRSDCGSGDYSSWSSATFTPNYCVPTTTYTPSLYYITNFATTGGYTNISNSSSYAAYTNYSATQIVSKAAGTSFNYTGTKSGTTTTVDIWVDWNQDLVFDQATELVVNGGTTSPGGTSFSGTITIPAGTPLGNYRMRVRSRYYTYTSSACGNINYGDAEDYTITVATQPADCVTPDAATVATSGVTASNITVTVTAPATAPTGYVLIRSTAATLSATPVNGTTYAVGTAFGGGTVVANSLTAPAVSDFVPANSHYYYFVFTYNDGGISCFGPIYSAVASADATSCAVATINSGASNIGNYSANLNWTSVVGNGGLTPTYTIEVYTDEALTALFGTYTATTNSYALSGLTLGATYYYRVKAETTGCDNDAWSSALSFATQSQYSPLDATGYSDDVIANGTGVASLSTTNDVDGVNNAYIALNYQPSASGSVTSVGLPVDRRLTNSGTTGLTFLMQDYSNNNSLRIPAQNGTGTLTLTNPVKLSNLYLAVTSGSGASTISVQVNFQDGTSQTASSFSLLDWYGTATTAQPALVSGIGRANRANTTGAVETGASKVFYVTLPIETANQTKQVSSVTVTKTSTGTTTPVPHVFALSGQLINECPVLNTAFTTPTATGASVNFGLMSGSVAAASYSYEVYTDAAYTTPVAGSPFTTTTTSLTVSGLSPLTTYYYRAQAVNTACTSSYITGSFTTLCATPDAPAADAQTFCSGATVANLVATGATGNTIKWYATADATTALTATTALSNGTYYVSQLSGTCESTRTAVTVTVNTVAAPTADAQTFCGSATVADLMVTAAEGATLTWYATVGGDAIETTAALQTGSYYVTQTVNGCTSTAATVSVTVNTIPDAPVADAQTFCGSATVANLMVTAAEGATLTWYATVGGDAIETTTALQTGSYYVTQTVNGCTSTAAMVSVTVNTVPDAPTADAQTFCGSGTVADLVVTTAEGATLTWYATEGGDAIETTTALETGSYYVTQTVNGCTSAVGTVSVTINAIPDAPVAEAQSFCGTATVADLAYTAAEGAVVTWYATEGGDAIETTTALENGTYYFTQTVNGCTSLAGTVEVTVTATPDAPVADAEQNFTDGQTLANLTVTFAEGTTATWYTLNGDEYVEIDPFTALVDGTTYYVSQSNGTCVSEMTAITVHITAGTNNVTNTTLTVYPNPATNVINVKSGAAISHLALINLLGQTVTEQTANGTEAQLNIERLSTGTYILQVTAGNKITTVKVVKQ
ncbi:GEVED domain-containing protein [Flavobacterium sp. RHBU_3]|uniref:GEVED domain-containing protein n=1 Tax=Flavobacterium sp. RHBU_3 TaxID=3391184 RepID=UPI003984C3FB